MLPLRCDDASWHHIINYDNDKLLYIYIYGVSISHWQDHETSFAVLLLLLSLLLLHSVVYSYIHPTRLGTSPKNCIAAGTFAVVARLRSTPSQEDFTKSFRRKDAAGV